MPFSPDRTNGTSTLDADDTNLLKHAFLGTLTDEVFKLTSPAGGWYSSGDVFFFERSGLAYIGVNCYHNGSTNWVRKTVGTAARLYEFSPTTNEVKVYTVASGGGRTYVASIGNNVGGRAPLQGEIVQANGHFTTDGDAQTSTLVSRIFTDSAGDLDLTLDGVFLATTSNTIVIGSNKTVAFKGLCVARRDDGSEVAAWEYKGIINHQTGVDCTISGSSVTAIGTPPSGWDFTLSADLINQALELIATSPASININWVAKTTLVEVS
jgi:hypothetical protein